ncbi:hypothetical protein BH23GEM7_BH23GEM7_39770 [soil metagenome]
MKMLGRMGRGGESRGPHLLALLALLALGGAASCGVKYSAYPSEPSIATLDAVYRQDREATGAELQAVQVVRSGARLPARVGMELQDGDWVETDAETRALLSFRMGYEVQLAPATHLVVHNPRATLTRGWAYVRKKLEQVRESFRVETEFVIAGTEGTEFLIGSEPGDVVTVTVVEGVVRLEPTAAQWQPVALRPLEQGTVRGDAPPQTRQLPRQEVDVLVARTLGAGVRVPSMVGQPEEEARRQLERQGFIVGVICREITGQAQPGTVIRQSPETVAGGAAGARVDLVVEEETVAVPGLEGRPRAEAERMLTAARLRVGRVTEEAGGQQRPGVVLRQSRRAGERVRPGTEVDLVLAAPGG